MAKYEISPVERVILFNQYQILKTIDPEFYREQRLEEKQEIVHQGFEGLYGQVLGGMADETVSEEEIGFANKVLHMMANILDYADELTDFDLSRAYQVGFDGNTEGGMLSYAEWTYSLTPKGYGKVTGVVNSHGETKSRYEKMLAVYWPLIQSYKWDAEGARATLEAGFFSKKNG